MVDSIHPIGSNPPDNASLWALYPQSTASAKTITPLKATVTQQALSSENALRETLHMLFEKAVKAMGRQDGLETTHYLQEYFKLLDTAQPGWKTSLNQGFGIKRYSATWMLASLKEVLDGSHTAGLFLTHRLGQELKNAAETHTLPTPLIQQLQQTLHHLEQEAALLGSTQSHRFVPLLQSMAQTAYHAGQAEWGDRLQLYALMGNQLELLRLQQPFVHRERFWERTGLPGFMFHPNIYRLRGNHEQIAWQAYTPIEHTDRVEAIESDPNEAEQRRKRRQQIEQVDVLLHPDDEDEEAIGGW